MSKQKRFTPAYTKRVEQMAESSARGVKAIEARIATSKKPVIDIDEDPQNANWLRSPLFHLPNAAEALADQQKPSPLEANPMAVTDRPWDGSASRFTPQQWRASCLIDTGEGDPDSKGRYKLPVKEPDGSVNANAVHAAAAALAGGRGGVQASPQQKKAAARSLVRLYGTLKEDAPPSIRNMAS